ncbi:LysR family transcriptional regulator [Alkalibacter mobilis]|uniref:LysR family transcriptional regulator n=1 Tax=Alkalibacter mobilis TaxID=2787712 RepID=UPI00189D1C68|nr:LysR family transcriptional regulator [Alkalibacter mobilis]MBF7095607.1 LysR family transcriptional regulator [Alkalibacter mobilis]
MNNLQIDIFLEVADCLSFTKAAEKLFVSQPAISKQISSLEKELDLILFNRESRNITLTESGRMLYECFVRMKTDFKTTMNKVKTLENAPQYNLTVTFLEGWDMSGILPVLLKSFKNNNPNIKINVNCHGFKEMIQLLNEGKTDLVLTISQALHSVKNVETLSIAEIVGLLTYSADHDFANNGTPTILDFKDETFFVPSSSLNDDPESIVKEICSYYGFTPKIEVVPNIDSMILNVENNLGVAIFDEWNRIVDNPRLRHMETRHKHSIKAAWKKNNLNPAIKIFVQEITRLLSQKFPKS